LIGINICLAEEATPAPTSANEENSLKLMFSPEVAIPGLKTTDSVEATGSLLGQVINSLYNYLVWLAGILAVMVIMIAGFQWVTAAGNQSKIGEAKERITGAIIGLVLAMGSYVLLYTVNPELIKIQDLSELRPITALDTYCEKDQDVEYDGQPKKGSQVPCGKVAKIIIFGEDTNEKIVDTTCRGTYCENGSCINNVCTDPYKYCLNELNDGKTPKVERGEVVSFGNSYQGFCVKWNLTGQSVGWCPYVDYALIRKEILDGGDCGDLNLFMISKACEPFVCYTSNECYIREPGTLGWGCENVQ